MNQNGNQSHMNQWNENQNLSHEDLPGKQLDMVCVNTPATVHEALNGSEKEEWSNAMEQEMKSI